MPSFEQMAWAAGKKSLADLRKKTQKATEPQPIGLGSGEWTDLEIERIRSISKSDPKRIDSLIDGMTDAEVEELTNAMKSYDQKKSVYKKGAEDVDLTASGAPPGLSSVMPAYEQPEMAKSIAAGARKSKVLSGTMFASDKEIAKEIGIPYERISRIPGYREGMLMESYQSGIPAMAKAVQRMKASGKPDVAAAAESLEMEPEPAFIAGALGRVKEYVRGAGRLGKQSLKAITPSKEGSEKWDDNIILSEATRLAEELPKREAYGENPAYLIGGIAADIAIPSPAGKIKAASRIGKAVRTTARIVEGAGQAAITPDDEYVSPEDYWSTVGEKAKTGAMWTAGILGGIGSGGFLARKTLENFPSLARRVGVDMVPAKDVAALPEDIRKAERGMKVLQKEGAPDIKPTRATLSGSEAVRASELESANYSQDLTDTLRSNLEKTRQYAKMFQKRLISKWDKSKLLEMPIDQIERVAASPGKRQAEAKSLLDAYRASDLDSLDAVGVNIKSRALKANMDSDILFDDASNHIRLTIPSDPVKASKSIPGARQRSIRVETKEPTGLVDKNGDPITRTVVKEKILHPIWTGENTIKGFKDAIAEINKLDFLDAEAKRGFVGQMNKILEDVESGDRVLDYDGLRSLQKQVRALKNSLTDNNTIKQDYIDQMKINPLSTVDKHIEKDIESGLANFPDLLSRHKNAVSNYRTNVAPYSDVSQISKAIANDDWAGLYNYISKIEDKGKMRDALKLLGPQGRNALVAARMNKAMEAASTPQGGVKGVGLSVRNLARQTDVRNDPVLRELLGPRNEAEWKGFNRLLASVGFAEGSISESAEGVRLIATKSPVAQSIGLSRQLRLWWNANAYHKDPTFRRLLKRAAVASPDKLKGIITELQRIASRYKVGRKMDARNAPKEDMMPVGSPVMDDFDAEAELDKLESSPDEEPQPMLTEAPGEGELEEEEEP